ncbi:SsrA-binding protein [Buchnera aphidicola (Cinara pseudotaxifoliae)]|uniref:SsrA-binding protein n=1 Tax=Buchnera aphidicola (Cinara pseudotaxifoliae) TaxID=655384 RepID=A0A451DGU7_9GAMM|nr:SsrA-binding protein SmpB [Buchnera aphidicola]VFP85844.1 SsrA-binding protein [Buchnera aphidicola (Cinara pseudotaxifoliae)]
MSFTKKKNKKKVFINKKAQYNFFIKKTIISGIVLQGWEVKSIRLGHVQLTSGYITINNNEIYLIGVHIQPLTTVVNSCVCQSDRTRKLLLHKKEIGAVLNYIQKKGYTVVPLKLFWRKSWCKIKIGIAKGKSKRDKRLDEKNNSWKIDQSTIFKRISLNKKR